MYFSETLCRHTLANLLHIPADKFEYSFVILAVLIAQPSALYNFHCLQRNFYGLYPFTVYGSRKDKGLRFEIISSLKYAMMFMCNYS